MSRRVTRLPSQAVIRWSAASGAHPGSLPNSGVFATSNSIATPALLPDGSISEQSVSQVLAGRGAIVDAPALAQTTQATVAALERVQDEEDE